MFSKSDPGNTLKRLRATIKTRAGESETGAILIPAHRTLRELLNDDGPFLETGDGGGGQAFLLKAEIARIDPIGGGEPRAADRPANDWSRFDADDARLVLGVGGNATEAEIHAAWRDAPKPIIPTG